LVLSKKNVRQIHPPSNMAAILINIVNWVILDIDFFWGLFGKIKHAKIKQTPKIKTPKLSIVNCNEPTHK
jgi:hypothetical protein